GLVLAGSAGAMSENGRLPDSELAPIANGRLRKDAAAAWNAMNVEARARGCELLPSGSMSSYRTYAQQVFLWNLYVSGRGNLAAHPGSSLPIMDGAWRSISRRPRCARCSTASVTATAGPRSGQTRNRSGGTSPGGQASGRGPIQARRATHNPHPFPNHRRTQ